MIKEFSSEKLLKAMQQKNISPSELVFRLEEKGQKVTLQAVMYWLQNETKPGSEKLEAIARITGRKMEYFFEQKTMQCA